LIASEHKCYGTVCKELQDTYPKDNITIIKTVYSGVLDEVREYLSKHIERENIVLYGVETSITVL